MGRVDFGLIGEKLAHLANEITSYIQRRPIIEGSLLLLILIEFLMITGLTRNANSSYFLSLIMTILTVPKTCCLAVEKDVISLRKFKLG